MIFQKAVFWKVKDRLLQRIEYQAVMQGAVTHAPNIVNQSEICRRMRGKLKNCLLEKAKLRTFRKVYDNPKYAA